MPNLVSGKHIYFVRACNVVGSFEECSNDSANSQEGTVNLPHTAVDDSTNTDEDTPVNYNVVANDLDPDSNPEYSVMTITSVTSPANGSVVIDGNLVSLIYTPASNFHGNDNVTYTVSDGASTDTAVFNITVNR